MGTWHLSRAFDESARRRITSAVAEAEQGHTGQIRVVVEGCLRFSAIMSGVTARERAISVFAAERVWDTEHNNGVLLYLLLAERDAEIVADRGFNGKVTSHEWEEVCKELETSAHLNGLQDAILAAVARIGDLIRREYSGSQASNELPDEVLIRRSMRPEV